MGISKQLNYVQIIVAKYLQTFSPDFSFVVKVRIYAVVPHFAKPLPLLKVVYGKSVIIQQ
jgi:hypothetical protein